MSCLKLSAGCLALVGLAVLLVVGSCTGLIAWGIFHGIGLPERATRTRIESDHRGVIAEVRRQLDSGTDASRWRAPAGLVAVRERTGAEDSERNLLSGGVPRWGSHSLINEAGVGTVDGRESLIYVVHCNGREYWAYIADPGPAPGDRSQK